MLLMKTQCYCRSCCVIYCRGTCYWRGCCVTDEGAVLQGRVLLLLTIVYVSLHKTAQCGIIKVFFFKLNYRTGRCAIGECAIYCTYCFVTGEGAVYY